MEETTPSVRKIEQNITQLPYGVTKPKGIAKKDSEYAAFIKELWLKTPDFADDLIAMKDKLNLTVDDLNELITWIAERVTEVTDIKDVVTQLKAEVLAAAAFGGVYDPEDTTKDWAGYSCLYQGEFYISLISPNVGNIPADDGVKWKSLNIGGVNDAVQAEIDNQISTVNESMNTKEATLQTNIDTVDTKIDTYNALHRLSIPTCKIIADYSEQDLSEKLTFDAIKYTGQTAGGALSDNGDSTYDLALGMIMHDVNYQASKEYTRVADNGGDNSLSYAFDRATFTFWEYINATPTTGSTLVEGSYWTQIIDFTIDFDGGKIHFKNLDNITNHMVLDTLRGADNVIYSDANSLENTPTTSSLISFNGATVTLGLNDGINESTSEIIAYPEYTNKLSLETMSNGKKHLAQYDAKSGRQFGLFQGSDSIAQIKNYLGKEFKYFVVKKVESIDNTTVKDGVVYTNVTGKDKYLNLYATNGTYSAQNTVFWNNTKPNDEYMTIVGDYDNVNNEGSLYYYEAYTDSDTIKVFAYDGNGINNKLYADDGTFIGEIGGTSGHINTAGYPYIAIAFLDQNANLVKLVTKIVDGGTGSWITFDYKRGKDTSGNPYYNFLNLTDVNISNSAIPLPNDNFSSSGSSTYIVDINGTPTLVVDDANLFYADGYGNDGAVTKHEKISNVALTSISNLTASEINYIFKEFGGGYFATPNKPKRYKDASRLPLYTRDIDKYFNKKYSKWYTKTATDLITSTDPLGRGNLLAKYLFNGNATDETGNYDATASGVSYVDGELSGAFVPNDTAVNDGIICPVVNAKSVSLRFKMSKHDLASSELLVDARYSSGTAYLRIKTDLLLSWVGIDKVKVNGEIVASSDTFFIQADVEYHIEVEFTNLETGFVLGNVYTLNSTASVFSGYISLIEFYSDTLTDGEILKLYNQETSSWSPVTTPICFLDKALEYDENSEYVEAFDFEFHEVGFQKEVEIGTIYKGEEYPPIEWQEFFGLSYSGNPKDYEVEIEVLINGEWGKSNWIFDSTNSGYGANAECKEKGIYIVTGANGLMTGNNIAMGNTFSNPESTSSAPAKIIINYKGETL